MTNNHDKDFRRRKMRLEESKSTLDFISSILINLIAIAVFIGAYYYFIVQQGMFSDWATYIYWGMKVLVGYNIIAASARSLLAPILTALIGIASLAAPYIQMISPISASDTWQLLAMSIVGLVIYIAVGG